MEKVKEFFKTSPLDKKDIVARLIALSILEIIFIGGGTALLVTKADIGALAPIAMGIILFLLCLAGINPKAFVKFFRRKQAKVELN